LVVPFLKEVHRVLKPGGIHRICVPDLRFLFEKYDRSYAACEKGGDASGHDGVIAGIFDQCVRKEASGTSLQRQPLRMFENIILGDARRRGETHQWMYDFFNLKYLLETNGFENVTRRQFMDSDIVDWEKYGLELDESGCEYKLDSLYVECKKTGM